MVKLLALACGLSGTAMILQGCGGAGDDDGPTPEPHVIPKGSTTAPTTAPGDASTVSPSDDASTTAPADDASTTTAAPKSTTSTTSTTTTTTTTTPDTRTPPMSGKDVAAYLNRMFTAFDEEDPDSAAGVIVRTTKEFKFYCDGFTNYTGCSNGRAECISSASILNNRVMLKPDGVTAVGLQRSTGIIFNTSMMETRLGRCTYQYDGGSLGRYNRGCGTMAYNGKGGCDNKASAWFNIDPKTGKECTDESSVVLNDYCPVRIHKRTEPVSSGEPPCFWKGPAFYSKSGFIKSESHEMLKQRIRNQKGTYDLMTTWDEVVVDGKLLYEDLISDPTVVVPAMLYHWSTDHRHTNIAKTAATRMAKEMQKEFNMPWAVPVVGVDTTFNVTAEPTKGPFFFGHRPTPAEGPCCWGGCDAGSCKADYCGESKANCEQNCGGQWCPEASTATFLNSVMI